MRIVNLASRPFLNRRPVRRIAVLLWIVGGLLFVLAAWLYGDYLRGTAINRARLAEIASEIEAEDKVVRNVAARLQRLDLAERNARVEFLNGLIERRTFPWSRLFDDLEDVLVDEIYLQTVSPQLEEDEQERRSAGRRVITPAEARERARRERRGEPAPEAEERAQREKEPEYVELGLDGTARTDEALLDFVDVLYAAERFHEPYLSSETRKPNGREVQFVITVKYLLPRTPPPPTDVSDVPERVATTQTSGTPGSPEAGSPAGMSEPSADETRGAAADGSREPPTVVVDSPTGGGRALGREAEPPPGLERVESSRRSTDTPPASARDTAERSSSPERPSATVPSGRAGANPPSQTVEPAPQAAPARRDAETQSSTDLAPDLAEPAASAARSLRPGGSGERRPEP